MTRRYKAWVGGAAIALSASALTVLAVTARAAGIPDMKALTYTGYLESAEGVPLSGAHSIEVKFWESFDAEDSLCSGSAPDTTLQSGRFQITLPESCSVVVKASPDIWVDVSVDGAPLGRTKLGAVPYALEAGHATLADQATLADDATHADAASKAEGALDARLKALEAIARPVFEVASANPGDPEYDGCRNQTGTFVIGACHRMAHYTCKARGYVTGWFRGDTATDALGMICVK
jgi:hypothetical protein